MGEKSQLIVVVDNDTDFLEWVTKHLKVKSIEIEATTSAEEAEKLFLEKEAALLIADLKLEPFDGIALLKKVRMRAPNAAVILNGVVFSTNAVIEAMRLGAFDVLRKEGLNFELKKTVERALQSVEEMRALESD